MFLQYLILPTTFCKKYCYFKTNVKSPIKTGTCRWFNIPRENRTCKLCACNEIGDKFLYLFTCTDVNVSHSRVICQKYFISNPNVVKLETVFNVTDINQLIKICKLLYTIFKRVMCLG